MTSNKISSCSSKTDFRNFYNLVRIASLFSPSSRALLNKAHISRPRAFRYFSVSVFRELGSPPARGAIVTLSTDGQLRNRVSYPRWFQHPFCFDQRQHADRILARFPWLRAFGIDLARRRSPRAWERLRPAGGRRRALSESSKSTCHHEVRRRRVPLPARHRLDVADPH